MTVKLDQLTVEDKQKALLLAEKELAKRERRKWFDPDNAGSKPTPQQLEVLKDFGNIPQQWLVAGNRSGKSQLAARIISWVLEESHPHWKRPECWGNKPIQIVLAGKNSKIIEEEIWKGKIKRYLEPGSYKEIRSGNQLQKIEMRESGNTLVFQSYENINQARERVQGYTAHLCVVDEMPSSDALISELSTRAVTIGGYFLASFTPLLVNQNIRKRVDNALPPSGKRYKLSMWDNPAITEKAKQEWLAANAHLSEAEIKARIYGDWISPNDAVYYWDADQMLVPRPMHYSYSWRHVLSVDPGSNSPTGMGIFAEDPHTGNWYLMRCWYLTIAEPNALVQKVIELSSNYNIVKRVVDSGYSSWFREIAKLHGLSFSYPIDKTHSRKMELIKQLQFALGGRLYIVDGEDTSIFVDEVTSCHWADSEQAKIAKASRFHVLDMAQYFIDCMPKFEGITPPQNWWTPIRQAQEEEMNGKVQLKDALQHRKHIDIKKNAVRRKGMGRWPM